MRNPCTSLVLARTIAQELGCTIRSPGGGVWRTKSGHISVCVLLDSVLVQMRTVTISFFNLVQNRPIAFCHPRRGPASRPDIDRVRLVDVVTDGLLYFGLVNQGYKNDNEAMTWLRKR